MARTHGVCNTPATRSTRLLGVVGWCLGASICKPWRLGSCWVEVQHAFPLPRGCPLSQRRPPQSPVRASAMRPSNPGAWHDPWCHGCPAVQSMLLRLSPSIAVPHPAPLPCAVDCPLTAQAHHAHLWKYCRSMRSHSGSALVGGAAASSSAASFDSKNLGTWKRVRSRIAWLNVVEDTRMQWPTG